MGLLEKIFKKTDLERQTSAYFKMLSAYQPVYHTYEGGVYEMALTRAAINSFAQHTLTSPVTVSSNMAKK